MNGKIRSPHSLYLGAGLAGLAVGVILYFHVVPSAHAQSDGGSAETSAPPSPPPLFSDPPTEAPPPQPPQQDASPAMPPQGAEVPPPPPSVEPPQGAEVPPQPPSMEPPPQQPTQQPPQQPMAQQQTQQKQPPPQPLPSPPAQPPGAQALGTPAADASKPLADVFLEPYVFDMREGRRNPFKPYVLVDPQSANAMNLPGTPLERYELDEIKLVGIMWQIKAPKAMFVDPQGEVHVLTKDDRIGRHHGYIAAIREGEVVIIEPGSVVGESAYSTRILQLDRDQKDKR